MQSIVSESQIINLLKLLSSSIAHDINGLTLMFNRLLQLQQKTIISFMNYQLFRSQSNLIQFLHNSITEGPKSDEQIRKLIYGFIGDYIVAYKQHINDYLAGIFQKIYAFFKKQTNFRPKAQALSPLRQILHNFNPNDLNGVLNTVAFHKSLTTTLKIESKMSSTVKGELWVVIGILQNKFASSISFSQKKDVQTACLAQLKELVKKNENFSTIASILKSLTFSLNQNYLSDNSLQQVFNYAKAIMIPLTQTYGASIAALQLITAQSQLFHTFIMKNAAAIFKTLTGLMGHQNKQYKFAVLDTLSTIVKQVVVGISSNLEDPKMIQLFNYIGNSMWGMLQQHTKNEGNKIDQKNRFLGSIIFIVKILGILSPLILSINGKNDLKRFFSKLLGICNRKVIRSFEQTNQSSGITKKIHLMKLILYNQKQLISFISSFAKILEQLETIQYRQALNLEQLFLVGVRQYPFYFQKYIPQLVQSMVHFLMGLFTKPNIFIAWCKKIVLISLMQSLDAKRFNINTSQDYYLMIKKSARMWSSILTHTAWKAEIRKQFSTIVFDSLQHLFLNLDISYKTNIQLDIQNQEEQRQREQQLELVNIFFMSDQNIQMSNISDYQYVSSLALIFNELLLKIDQVLYTQKVYSFYEQVIYRLKIFPKSIPLMKVIRSLNAFITRTGWINTIQSQNVNKIKQILSLLSNFFKFICENLYKYQENYFYEALKMLVSMPFRIFLMQDCEILKNHLNSIICKSLQLGQQIISLASETIECLANLFARIKQQSVAYLSTCIPYLQKYINFSKNKQQNQGGCQQKQQFKSYLFLYERSITRKQISANVMKFLGSIGGIAHMMVDNSTKDYISWDYYCKLDLAIVMGGQTIDINLTKLLSRTCWLMLHGSEAQKIVSSQFMHAIMVYVIGRAAFRVQTQNNKQNKQNISNFFDRVLPTLLNVSSNPSHPCHQLIHSLIIQTVHFLANTQDSNSPDIQTLLKNLIAMYTGAEDLSFLASRCLSQLVKWHIKQSPQSQVYPYPLVKTVVRNVWSLISNKKARNGLIQFLIKFLKAIHRNTKLMSIYAIQLCSLIISLGRTDKQMQHNLDYLVRKYIMAIGPFIKNLILEQDTRRFKKLSTLQKLMQWIYNNSLFSIYRQQRIISYKIWESILTNYGNSLNCSMEPYNKSHNIQIFLYEQCNRQLKYLFAQNKLILILQDEPKFDKQLPKITAYGQMWNKIITNNIFQASKIRTFRDFQEVYLQSFSSFIQYLSRNFAGLTAPSRILSYQSQKAIIECLLNFIEIYLSLEAGKNNIFIIEYLIKRVPIFQKQNKTKQLTLVQIMFKLVFRPNSFIPNFNYDLIYECSENSTDFQQIKKQNQSAKKQQQQYHYFQTICKFLQSLLSNNLIPKMNTFLSHQFKISRVQQLIPYIINQSTFYDREIRCVLATLAIFANSIINFDTFMPIIMETLTFTTDQIQHVSSRIMQQSNSADKQISIEKKNLLLWYILEHVQKYEKVRNFIVGSIKNDSIIYQKYQKIIMKSIVAHWSGFASKIINLVKTDNQFLKTIFVLCKMLNGNKLQDLYALIQTNLINFGLQPQQLKLNQKDVDFKTKSTIISEMLKICYFIAEESNKFYNVSGIFVQYLYNLILEGLSIQYSMDIQEQALNLSGVIIRKQNYIANIERFNKFIENYRKCLSKLTKFYIPINISKLTTPESRNKCVAYLKMFKSMVILSNDIRYLQFIFIIIKDQDLQGYYAQILQDIINQCLNSCFQNVQYLQQYQILQWMINFYWEPGFDTDCWANIRVVVVDQILRKAIKMAKQETLIKFFQQQVQKLINHCFKQSILTVIGSIKQLVLHLQLKRAAFVIIQQLYSNLPRKQKNTQQIHKKQLHKQIIKQCNQYLKPKLNEFSKQIQQAQAVLLQYDRKMVLQDKEKIQLKTQKQAKKIKAIEYLRKFYCSVYNCLVVTFISTQSNKAHFQTYLFQSKGMLWKKLLDENQQDFNFQIQTNFPLMNPVSKINKQLNKKIKNKYWQNSLYAIQQQYVPASLIQNIPISVGQASIAQQKPKNNSSNENINLELDLINKHPCMINLLRVIDFMDEKFNDGTLPGWMKPIHQQLLKDNCPLAIRILLTKLIINRPNIFTQNIWAQVLFKYLLLKENGGKFIHYFFRDVIRHYLTFVKNGYKPDKISDANIVLMKVIRALPHQKNFIYNYNIDIMRSLLKIQGVWINKQTVVNMLKANQKSKPEVNLKFEWRMCITMVLKCCLEFGIPVLDQNEHMPNNNLLNKFKFFLSLRKQGLLNLIFQMAGQNVKKYRLATAGFLGQLLKFVTDSDVDRTQQQELLNVVVKFLLKINLQQSNRNSKQKFSLCVLNVAIRYPKIVGDRAIYNQLQSSLLVYCKYERLQIIQTLNEYCKYLIAKGELGFIHHIFMTIRGSIYKLLSDIQQVQSILISLINECCTHYLLANKQIIQTYYYIYDQLERVYSNSTNQKDAMNYYKVIILLKDFTNDPDQPKTTQIRFLGQKTNKTLLRGLGSTQQQVKKFIFAQLERESKDHIDSADRMMNILIKLYDTDLESLWLINVVPLIFSLVKQSSDYTRLRFEKPLSDITAYYDWDFRKNLRAYNSSQPFTPAFTLSTGANVPLRRPDGTIQPSFNATMGGDKLRGIIRASQNSYMSQQEQVFTILASQSQYQTSFDASYGLDNNNDPQKQNEGLEKNNQLTRILNNVRRRRNKHIQDFKQNNMKKYNSAISVVDNNKVRFNKNLEQSSQALGFSPSYGDNNQTFVINTGNKKISVRKYKVGQLPDIQISTRDLMDPMLYLASCDHEFASQLFILIFMKICLYSRKQKKQKFKETLCWLLKSSKKCDYNFISTLEKSLICLCHNQKQKIDFSMKQIALKSNTLDYAIIFTEENQIQTLKQPDFQNQLAWQKKVDQIWGDLIDLYQQINEQDLIYGVLIKLASGDQKKLLLQALNLKKLGNIRKSEQFLNAAMQQSGNKRIKQFIAKEKIDCSTILGAWEPISIQMNKKMQEGTLSVMQQKIFTVALQNTIVDSKTEFMKKIQNFFHQSKCEYEKATLYMLYQKDYDMAFHHLQKSIQFFSEEWKKISSFAFNSKHGLLEEVQKKFQLQQFLELYKKDQMQNSECIDLFLKWSSRKPDSVYDSNLYFLQILESRKMFSQLLSQKFKINQKLIVRATIDWLIQMSNGMVEKGVLGGAQTLIKQALLCKRKEKDLFIWQFYQSVAKLKLKQLEVLKSRLFNDYEIVANLVKKQMDSSSSQVTELQKFKYVSLKNNLFEAYLSSCLSSENPINTADFVNKTELIFGNYNQLRKGLKQSAIQNQTPKQFQQYRREMYFDFTLFLQKMLTNVSQKSNYPQIRDAMIAKNYKPQRLSHLFVEMLFTSIQISDFTNNLKNIQQNMVFSLIMKLIKIIQAYPTQVGEYFSDTIGSKRIPVWIFLYFIPQMIKFINNPNLVTYFQDLFKNIANYYPQALVYHFNCSYQLKKDRHTQFCHELSDALRQKMSVNYHFIQGLILLQYPQIRLRQSLNKFLTIQYQRQNAIIQLKQLIKHNEMLGKYNRKFVEDYQSKITRVINKAQSNDFSITNDIKIILANIDPSKKDKPNIGFLMKDFVKVSDGSLFFQQYNSNDWNRIQIPGTSYRTFEEPKPWKRLFIQSFDHSLLTLQSKQRPKRIMVYGSNEKRYMFLVKAGQDVRLDQRIQQLFEIMNRILKTNSDCSKKQLQIRRFEVTPIKKMMGIFEWVNQSQTLKQFLETQFKIIKQTDKINFKQRNKAFEYRMEFLTRLSPPNPAIKDHNHQHKALLNANRSQVVKCFIQCQKQIPYGLLRRALERLSKNYDSFLHIKNAFIANYALICCVTYILGIGDRHLQNFLIHMGSASVVPIDFGYSFGASLQLGVPQLMPFRLTKCFQQLMDPIGFEGVFKKCMISSFQALSQNVVLISDYCEVFVDDPLLEWIWTNKKNISQSSKIVQFSNSQDPPQKALFAQKVLSVRKKLQGCNPRMLYVNLLTNSRHKHAVYAKTLEGVIWGQSKNREKKMNISDVVDELISMATDKNILGRTYVGWNPYV